MKINFKGFKTFIYRLLVVGLIVFMNVGTVGAAPTVQPGLSDLVRIDLEAESRLADLAGLHLIEVARLYPADGGLILVVSATPQQQQALKIAGFGVRILESPARADNYFLLRGEPELLEAAGNQVDLLLIEGNQALVHAEPERIGVLEVGGLRSLNLIEQPLVVPRLQVEALAAPQAPMLTHSWVVQQMVNTVQQNTLYNYIAQLTGEQTTIIDGAPYTILTRYTSTSQPIRKATRYAYEHFQRLGLPVGYDYYTYYGVSGEKRSVIAEQTGLTDPSRVFLVTAHLDSRSEDYTSSMSYAPGADDNASGSAAVMAIADILSRYHFGCTIRYVLFTGEEQGLFGSHAYAADMLSAGENIDGVLNLDMLGYNTPGSLPSIELHTRPGNSGDLYFANLFSQAVTTYSLSLIPEILQDGLQFSDHYPFWQRGYPAILAIEDWDDHTPRYHKTTDRLETLNMPYYTAFVKAALATFAHMGCLVDGSVAGAVADSASGELLPGVQISAAPVVGAPFSTTTDSQGSYGMILQGGSYDFRFSAPDYRTEVVDDVQVPTGGQTTVLNRALQPCSTVKDPEISAATVTPALGEEIMFQAGVTGGQQPVTYNWSFSEGGGGTGAQILHSYASRGIYQVHVTANNSCDYPLQAGIAVIVDLETVYLPYVGR